MMGRILIVENSNCTIKRECSREAGNIFLGEVWLKEMVGDREKPKYSQDAMIDMLAGPYLKILA